MNSSLADSINLAARRRDFTINALALDLETGEIIGPFGGIEDIRSGTLRVTDPATFVEDPLRLFRAMQLLPRKATKIEANTLTLCKTLRYHTLPQERVYEEWRKLLLMSDTPSIGLNYLREIDYLPPELFKLIGCPQNPEWHPEGDVWIHTCHVIDAAARLRHLVDLDWQEAFMWGCLLHDVGKPATTDPIKLTAYGHDTASAKIALQFMERLTKEIDLTSRVLAIVENHLQPHFLSKSAKPSAYRRLHNRIRLDVIAIASVADYCGRAGRDPIYELPHHEPAQLCLSHFSELGKERIAPILQGRHLVEAGLKPGPEFSRRLAKAYDSQLEDESLGLDALLQIALDC